MIGPGAQTPTVRPCVAVAYSGGRDSTALLHATVAAAAGCGIEVIALHVHHGLSRNADRWLAHCAARCRRWRTLGAPLEFASVRIAGRPARGESVEAWARRERHAALAGMAQAAGASLLLLAQHRHDQAETFVLQALRGAGAAGLAGMPQQALRGGIVWARPWLDVPGSDVAAYVRAHRLRHVDDDSNADPRFARNRLRRDVWPALARAFPHVDAALADAARRAADAAQCAGELAAIDLGVVTARAGGLDLAAWGTLGAARRRNALRVWLAHETASTVPAALIERLTIELTGTAPAQWPCGRHVLRRYRDVLRCEVAVAMPTAGVALSSAVTPSAHGGDAASDGSRIARSLTWPGWPGRLDACPVDAGGMSEHRLAGLRPVARSGGEQFQRTPRSPPRSLKKAFQAQGVPAWARAAPLFYGGGLLIFVPGLGIDARALAGEGESQVALSWHGASESDAADARGAAPAADAAA